jgi:hypothetical protein
MAFLTFIACPAGNMLYRGKGFKVHVTETGKHNGFEIYYIFFSNMLFCHLCKQMADR